MMSAGSEWLRWRQTIGRPDVTAHLSVMPSAYGGLFDEKAHLSVMPGAYSLDCNTPVLSENHIRTY